MFFRQADPAVGRPPDGSQWALASGSATPPPCCGAWSRCASAPWEAPACSVAFLVTLPAWLGPGSMLEVSTLVVLGHRGVLDRGPDRLGRPGEPGPDVASPPWGRWPGAVAMIDWHWDLSLALLLAGAAGGGWWPLWSAVPTLRLDGVFVAVTTLAFGLAVSGYLLDRAEFSVDPVGPPADAAYLRRPDRLAERGVRHLSRRRAPGGAGHARPAAQPLRPGAAGPQHQ